MALLAAYVVEGNGKPLDEWLNKEVFADAKISTVEPDAKDVEGFNKFFENYTKGLAVERAAVESL